MTADSVTFHVTILSVILTLRMLGRGTEKETSYTEVLSIEG